MVVGSRERLRVFVSEFVTGGGLAGKALPPSWEAEGGLMRRALAQEFASLSEASVVTTLDERLADEPGAWKVMRVGPGDEERVFLEQAAASDFTLVIAPETGRCLETRAHWIRDAGGRSLGSEPSAIAQTTDKLDLARLLVRRDIRTPPTRRFSKLEGLPTDFRYPAVLKPVDGAGSLDTLIVESAEDHTALARYPHHSGVLQPYLPGIPMSASYLVTDSGKPRLVAVAVQKIVRNGFELSYVGGTIPSQTIAPDQQVRRAVEAVKGLRGFVGVDFLWNEEAGRSTVLEINPRPTTTVVAVTKLLEPGTLAREWLRILSAGCPDPSTLPCLVRTSEPYSFGLGEEGHTSHE